MPPSSPDNVGRAPRFNPDQAERLSHELFGVSGRVRPLASERDQNFRVTTEEADFVLKIANPTESREVLELQNDAMQHVIHLAACPRVLPMVDGSRIARIDGEGGDRHFVRLLTYLPGRPLATVKPHDPALLRSLGQFFGKLDRALADFDRPAAHRDFHWDLRNAGRIVGRYRERIGDPLMRGIVDGFHARFEDETAPLLETLRESVIHADGNDHNMLVSDDGDWGLSVTGAIDFGDMVHGHTVCEVAIAAAYAVLGKHDPVGAAAHVVAGYHAVWPLTDDELRVIHSLICMRLCTSICIAAEQRAQVPDNEYLSITEQPAQLALQRLAEIHPRLAEYRLRQACGLPACPAGEAVTDWLAGNREQLRPVVPIDPARDAVVVFDLSVGSRELADLPEGDTQAFTERLFGALKAAGVPVGIGRYDEPRVIYAAKQFEGQSDGLPERRTIHLGLDLFMEAGTSVHTPLMGTIHSLRDNALPLDYGPTIIVQHEGGEGRPFYTLYGHLDPSSLDGLQPGMSVAAGSQIGTIGTPPRNGDWPPHLHLQLIADLLDEQGNFPGVATPGTREVWLSICPDPNLLLGIPADRLPPAELSTAAIHESRRSHLGPSLSLSYAEPLAIVRGRGANLFDATGQAYLDVVNNVCHVGHCHPRVVQAGRSQMALLNTNTRYLHPSIVDYAERLCAALPDPLSVCYFVCSGSEANELALRMARSATGRRDIVTLEGAYHGNTQGLIDISPYKFDGRGGAGPAAHVHKVAMPDGYRGAYKGQSVASGRHYAEHVRAVIDHLARSGRVPAAFICESLLGCGGQIVLPDGYLAAAYDHVRGVGGICIADEVQVGFGRVGSHFWGFELQGVVPDIVTLGKPIGNGHPLAAVITTPEIAASFANGMEYFNTFGGNPVSCAIGLAVLDVVADEGLQQHALEIGERLKAGLTQVAEHQRLIGDVRGRGLFLGVELVLDHDTLEPAPAHATRVVERMKQHGILLSTDGPLANVIKMKPPLTLKAQDADRIMETLNETLSEHRLSPPT